MSNVVKNNCVLNPSFQLQLFITTGRPFRRVVLVLTCCCWCHDTLDNDIQHSDTHHNDFRHSDTQYKRHNDTQLNDTQQNDIQHNNTQHDYIQHNDKKTQHSA